mmetsp:Transcript_7831/g.22484  ORF Transcript_7831/g.22484 Transcript_7831/m.22484 type:complete len:360 (+) Transcript_7831:187-1266(+)
MIYDEGDANPLHRRIPGEVVSRRRVAPKRPGPEKEPDEVVVDLRTAVLLKPEARLKWLTKAVKMVTDGTASSTDLYDIVVNRKFVSGMPERVVRKVSVVIQDSLDLFSDKQQRYLSSNDCPIMSRLTARDIADLPEEGRVGDLEDDIGGKPSPPAERRPEPPAAAAAQRSTTSRPLPQAQAQALAAAGSSTWTSVKDEWAIRRAEAESKEQSKRDAARRAEKEREQRADEEAADRRAAEAEAERQRKLAEEADALLSDALLAPPVPLMSTSSSNSGRKRARSLSRSRSMSSRTARRLARQNRNEKASKRGAWRSELPEAMSGSRAILMNRNFVEDLPHMPRPNVPGIRGIRNRSRSRGR